VESIPRPPHLEELYRLARKLSCGIPFVRVDFYLVSDRPLFSEITFFPASGLTPFVPASWDTVFGSWLKLPASE